MPPKALRRRHQEHKDRGVCTPFLNKWSWYRQSFRLRVNSLQNVLLQFSAWYPLQLPTAPESTLSSCKSSVTNPRSGRFSLPTSGVCPSWPNSLDMLGYASILVQVSCVSSRFRLRHVCLWSSCQTTIHVFQGKICKG